MGKKRKVEYKDDEHFYDIESLKNLFSLIRIIPATNDIKVYLWLDASASVTEELKEYGLNNERVFGNPLVKEKLAQYINYVNQYEFGRRNIKVTADDIRPISEYIAMLHNAYYKGLSSHDYNCIPHLFCFNSKSYDMLLLIKVIKSIPANLVAELSEGQIAASISTDIVRGYSDEIIHADKPWQVLSKSAKDFQRDITDTNKFTDIRILNEKLNKSLKKLSGQKGLRILESEKVKDGRDTIRSIAELAEVLSYNASDVINEIVLFESPEYQVPYTEHSALLERFRDRYIDPRSGKMRVSSDATSANLIEYVISPESYFDRDDSLHGKAAGEVVDLFFPTNNKWTKPMRKYLQSLHPNNFDQIKNDDNQSAMLTREMLAKMEEVCQQKNWPFNPKRFRWLDNHVEEDLLELLSENFDLPEQVYRYYDVFRGRSGDKETVSQIFQAQRSWDNMDNLTYDTQSKSNTVMIGVGDTDSYVNFSIGGNHGEFYDHISYNALRDDVREDINKIMKCRNYFGDNDEGALAARLTKREGFDGIPDEIAELNPAQYTTGTYKAAHWKKRLPKMPSIKDFAKTVYVKNCVHADVDSLYPTLLSILKVFVKDDGAIDEYAILLEERLRLKHSLPDDPNEYSAQDSQNNKIQKLNKLLLNAGSGKADAKNVNNIQVPTRILKMRICGQLIIAALDYTAARHGGTPVSTNTDGVYIQGVTLEESKVFIKQWSNYFGISAAPEIVELFVSKDANNRIEINADGKIKSAAGMVGSYKGINLSKSVATPTISDTVLLDYLRDEPNGLNPLTSPFQKDYVEAKITNLIDEIATELQSESGVYHSDDVINKISHFQWVFADNRAKNRFMVMYDEALEDVDIIAPNINELAQSAIKTHQSVNRIFLLKKNDYFDTPAIRLITATAKNAYDNPLARLVLAQLDRLTPTNELNNVDYSKMSHLSRDARGTIINQGLGEVPTQDYLQLLNNLDIDAYVTLIEELWHSWSDNCYVYN